MPTGMDALISKIDRLPQNPGVYLFKGARGEILYVGKAANIRHRVNSYFQKPAGQDMKTLSMLERTEDIEYIITDTEKEAFILEDNLIKEHHPRYNVKLRDDKNYPLLRLSLGEDFPTLSIVRRVGGDSSLYFGPYPSAKSLRHTLKMIQRIFPIRTSLDTKFTPRLRACRPEERAAGVCPQIEDPVQYRKVVDQVRMFLEGKNDALIRDLREMMKKEANRLNFEAAGRIRDQIENIGRVVEKQKIVTRSLIDQDVIGFDRRPDVMVIYLLRVRRGKLLGGRGFSVPSQELPAREILSAFLRQYYRPGRFIPQEILIPLGIQDQALVKQWLTERRRKKVRLLVPGRGDKKHLLQMARENAERFLLPENKEETGRILVNLREKLHLARIPRRIEAFDISNFQGRFAVGSLVLFVDGQPAKEGYRHFKIRTVAGADDYGMMEEVLLRRYQKVLTGGDIPDLVLLDGGRGQLNVAQRVFRKLGIKEVDLLSLAKERIEPQPLSARKKTGEKIFHPLFAHPFLLPKHSPLLIFLDRLRDEAHRFAITFHQKVRGDGALQSVLEEIPGIGPSRRRELLQFFGTEEKIRAAKVEELGRVPNMNRKLAQRVHDFFHQMSPPFS
jgi:excinuclease ABC subunit C